MIRWQNSRLRFIFGDWLYVQALIVSHQTRIKWNAMKTQTKRISRYIIVGEASKNRTINDEFIIASAFGAIKLKIVDFFSQTIKIIYSNRQLIAALKTIISNIERKIETERRRKKTQKRAAAIQNHFKRDDRLRSLGNDLNQRYSTEPIKWIFVEPFNTKCECAALHTAQKFQIRTNYMHIYCFEWNHGTEQQQNV